MEEQYTYGGQAVIEGVMIRGKRFMSVAVRRPDNTIAKYCKPLGTIFTGRLRRIVFLRGIIALAETLVLGVRALTYSANVAAESEGEELGRGELIGMISLSMLIAITVFFLGPVILSKMLETSLGSDFLANLIEGVIRLAAFIGYLVLIGRIPDIKRVFMYHGAEHMTVHATENGEALNTVNIQKYPPEHPRCGTAFLLIVVTVSVVVFVFVGRDPLWWLLTSRVVLVPFIAAASYELIRLSGRHQDSPFVKMITGPSLALQSLTTRQPEPEQIEIAITAMQLAIEADRSGTYARGPEI